MTHYQTDPNALNVPWVHSPFFEQLLAHLPLLPPITRGNCRTREKPGHLAFLAGMRDPCWGAWTEKFSG